MRALISSVLNLVSRKAPQTPQKSVATTELILEKTEVLLLSKTERKQLQKAKRKSVEKEWATSIIAGEKSRTPNDKQEFKEVGGGDKKQEPEYFKRVSGGDESVNHNKKIVKVKKVPKVYRRRLSDSSWTTEPMDTKLIWVDCEMTGLKVDSDMIMEIGCIVTDSDLKEIARTSSIIIHVPEKQLQGLDAWCLKHHGDSGLIDACRQSKVTSEEIDEQLLSFVEKHTKQGECPMAGNSIYMDRMFISKQFPKFHSHFHYRNVDVSTLKELVRRWNPEQYFGAPKKKFAHRVVEDIEDSIAELSYYRSAVFREAAADSTASSNLSDKI